ncbi:MAG: hypothetical protein E6G11_08865 [Actinobacteria bacterium]|nr:MAG: hypothetical protein E6G11_08865 [Actinomycetota bacterium]
MRRDCAATSITNRELALVGQIAASEMTLGNLDPDQPALGGVGKIPGPPDVDIGTIALRVFSRLAIAHGCTQNPNDGPRVRNCGLSFSRRGRRYSLPRRHNPP